MPPGGSGATGEDGMAEAKTRTDIINALEDHIADNGGKYKQWCVGVTTSPRDALYATHKVREGKDAAISRRAPDAQQAREVVKYFTQTQGAAQGRQDDGDGSVHVFAYRIRRHTKP